MLRCWNVTALAAFGLLNLFAFWTGRQPVDAAKRIVGRACALLLGGNLLRYLVVYPAVYHIIKIPAEFSTMAYFLVPMILLSRHRKWDCWAAYSGLMAGFFYYMAMIFAGQTLYGKESVLNVSVSLLCHGCLYFCGLVTITTERCPRRAATGLMLGVVYIAARAALLRPLVLGRKQMLIYILMDAIPARILLPEELWAATLPIYYVLLECFLLWSISTFFKLSERQYQKFSALRLAAATV